MRKTVFAALAVCSLTFPGSAQLTTPPTVAPKVALLPDLTVSGATQPPYTLANPCGAGESAIAFRLAIHNIGPGASTAVNDVHAIWVQDSANAGWAAGAPLPAIAASGTGSAIVVLLGLKNPDNMAGHHVFNVMINGNKTLAEQSYTNNSMTIAVDFPPGFCAPPVPVAGGLVAHGTPTSTAPPPGATVNNQLPPHLPAPSNLVNTITQGVCSKYGGSAGAFACSIGLPAGKLVLVWDYPSNVQIDGYRVYNTATNKVAATQSNAAIRLEVLDPPPAGTCFAVTAFFGSHESARSATSFCVSESNLTKSVSFVPDAAGTMVVTVFDLRPDRSDIDNEYSSRQQTVSYLLYMRVGVSHDPEGYVDTKIRSWMNSIYRGYLHFNTSSIAGHQIASAHLLLSGASPRGTICIGKYGASRNIWKPGQSLSETGGSYGGGPYAGPSVSLDVTQIVQSWMASTGSNNGLVLDPDIDFTSYAYSKISTTCKTSFERIKLDVKYY